jgi:hypothetical protein
VLGDTPRYAGHVRGTPRENFGVRTEKVDEHCFLFGVELGADPNLLGGVVVGVERDGLNRLCWLEAAGMALHVWRLLGEALQVGDEGLRFGEGLGVLHALHVAFVRVSVCGADGDDPCWGLVLKCYELRTRQHRMLNVKALRPLKHYFPDDLISFGRRSWMINYEGPTFVIRNKIMRNEI